MAELRKLADILPTALTELRNHGSAWQPNETPPPEGSALTRRGVPRGRENDTFESFDLAQNPAMKQAYDQCRKVARGAGKRALLCGTFGNGKTHLAIAAFREWNAGRKEPIGRFWKVPDFLSAIKRRAFDGEETVDQVIGPYQFGGALLILDDLGAENATDWASEQLFRVLDGRYDSGAPTIITSNKRAQELDGRIVSRFRDGMVVCLGKDLR